MEFSYLNSYVIAELAVTTQTFCIMLDFLQSGFWNRVMLQVWCHHYRSYVVVIMNSWVVTVYSFAPWKLICSTCHSFPLLFCLQRAWLFMSNSAGVSIKQGHLPYWCTWSMLQVFSGLRVAHLLLLLCMYYFGYFMFFVVIVWFPCLVFVPGLHSFDFRYYLDYSYTHETETIYKQRSYPNKDNT